MKTATTASRNGPAENRSSRRQQGDGDQDASRGSEAQLDDHARWLTSEQAGLRLGLGRQTLAEWRCERRTNQPPFARFGLKACRYNVAALDAWAAAQIVDHREDSHT